MDLAQLKQSIRDCSPAVHHDELLRSASQNGKIELLDLLLNSDNTIIGRWETRDELSRLKDPVLIRKLLDQGLDPWRRNDRGQRLAEVCKENGNDTLEQMLKEIL